MKTIIFILGIPFIPFFWLGLVVTTGYFSFIDFFKMYIDHYKSEESFGIFD